jgi:hypothetical protein
MTLQLIHQTNIRASTILLNGQLQTSVVRCLVNLCIDRIPTSQMEPELQKAIAQIKPNERDDVARSFFKHLKQRGLDERHLEQQIGLSTHNANRMSADDVSKLASFVYHNHPDIFREVLAEQPGILKFLSNPVVAAVLGIAAAKWLGGHHK